MVTSHAARIATDEIMVARERAVLDKERQFERKEGLTRQADWRVDSSYIDICYCV
jgi:hypothetical protein